MLRLIEAKFEECALIHKMQIIAFAEHLHKYHDYETNPGYEPLSKIEERFLQDMTTYYIIYDDCEVAGAVRVVVDDINKSNRISPIFILPRFRGKSLARKSLITLEGMYTKYTHWQLSTILEEEKLCRFYESLGYKKGQIKELKTDMHLVYYNKKRDVNE